MPTANYHIQKRDRFKDTADYLAHMNNAFSYDSTVQDYFYSAVHEAERFLAGLNRDSRSHSQREKYVTNYMILTQSRIATRAQFSRNPDHPSDRLFDRDSEFCYMELVALRLDVVYGNNILGQIRNANHRDVQRANHLLQRFFRAMSRHERNLRRRGII